MSKEKEATTEKEEPKEKQDPEFKKPSEMTPEELEEKQNSFFNKVFPGVSRPAAKKKDPETSEEEESEDEESEEQPPKKKADEEEEDTSTQKDPPKEEQARKVPPPPEEFVVPKDDEGEPEKPARQEGQRKLSKLEEENVEILKHMESMNPKATGIADEYKGFLDRFDAYRTKWEKENPDKKFRSKDEEHQEFIAANYPDIDDGEFRLAERDLIRKQASEEAKREARREVDGATRKQSIAAREHEFEAVAERSVSDLISSVGGPVEEILGKDESGKITVDKDALKKIRENNPQVADILSEEAEQLKVMVSELAKFAADPSYEMNASKSVVLKETGKKFYPHAALDEFISSFQDQLLRMPPEKTMLNGRRLISAEDYQDMVEKIQSSKASDKEKKKAKARMDSTYYILDEEYYRIGLVTQHAGWAKNRIDRIAKYASSPQKKEPGKEDEQKTSGKEEKPFGSTKRKSPSLASDSDAVDTGNNKDRGSKFSTKEAVNRLFGKV